MECSYGNSRSPSRAGSGGFTLTEIMIVVAIIGLLATLAVPELFRVRDRTWMKKCVNNLRLLQEAKYQYSIENTVPSTTVPGEEDIGIYIRGGRIPDEPAGGFYTIKSIEEDPVCNTGLEGHKL